MKQITKANDAYLSILGNAKSVGGNYRLMKYCMQLPVDDGVLLYNVPSREMVLLTEEEHANLLTSQYLREHWFVVPEDTNEKESVDMLRWVVENMQQKSDDLTTFIIMTTTDCNARCFYCFELGRSRIPMSEEVAHKTAKYIHDHCGGKTVLLQWYGGEPLYNEAVIDIICDDLRKYGVTFNSRAISNGYLFNDENVKKAAEKWNVNFVQISLDGTEEVYNKSKAYIYNEGSAYQRVLTNIGKLLDAGIKVVIRLNFDLYNAENLLLLVDELAERFRGKNNLRIYVYHLFDETQTMKDLHDEEAWKIRYDALHRLEDRIESYNLDTKHSIKNKLKTSRCLADTDCAVTITPTGNIGTCDHHSEDEFIGHLDTEGFDAQVLASWKERTPAIAECASCPYYAECILLKKCVSTSQCFLQFREDKLRQLQKCMRYEYQKWLSGENAEETEDENLSHQ